FLCNRRVNLDVIDDYVNLLRKQGVTGAFVNGTTGEGLSLTVDERKRIAEKWASASKGKLDLLILHITTCCILETHELARHAESLNVDAISLLPPFYYKYDFIAYFAQVSQAAPNTPIVYYHIPTFTGVNVKLSEFLPAVSKAVPALCGAKYSCSELSDLAGFMRTDKKHFKIFFGYEEMLLAALSLGVTAAIGGTFSYEGYLANKIIENYKKGALEKARREQDKLKHGVDVLAKYGYCVAALKSAGNELCGISFGDVRFPMTPVVKSKATEMGSELKALGIPLK
ncbi:unnamed protein product, partial [Ixodes hexagonus]